MSTARSSPFGGLPSRRQRRAAETAETAQPNGITQLPRLSQVAGAPMASPTFASAESGEQTDLTQFTPPEPGGARSSIDRNLDPRTQAIQLARQASLAGQSGQQPRVLAEPPVSFDIDLRTPEGSSSALSLDPPPPWPGQEVADPRGQWTTVEASAAGEPREPDASSGALDPQGYPVSFSPPPWQADELNVVGAGAAGPAPESHGPSNPAGYGPGHHGGNGGAPEALDEETKVLPASADPVPVASSRRGSERGRRSRRAEGSANDELPKTGRAGRDLRAAVGVGVLLAALALGSLLYRKEIFVGLASAAVVIALWELAGALREERLHVPVVPLGVGALGMLVSAYVTGPDGLTVALAMTAFVVLLWRIFDGVDGAIRDVSAAIFAAAYVPFLAGFSLLMLAMPDGAMRVIVFMLTTVASDIGGYAAGVLFGRHPMAPSLSPKKSWEGFAGSMVACVVVGVAGVVFLLHGPWWAGVLLGVLTAVSATVGDLSESVLKRGLGVKDMGNLLPGHGGLMDRMDSLLMTAPVAYLVLSAFVPV